MSPKYTLNKADGKKILQTVAYSGLSAVFAALLLVVADTDFPVEYAFLVPIINTILYAAKKFFEDGVQ